MNRHDRGAQYQRTAGGVKTVAAPSAGLRSRDLRFKVFRLLDPEAHQLDRDDLAVTLGEHACVRTILYVTRPDDDEVPRSVGGRPRGVLEVRRICIDPEFRARGTARVEVPLAKDVVGPPPRAGC